MATRGVVIFFVAAETHMFSKQPRSRVMLLEGLGVEGDAHAGTAVKHRSRVARDPNQPNLRQVHVLQTELFDELADRRFRVSSGDLGENISTRGLDLLGLCQRSRLHFSLVIAGGEVQPGDIIDVELPTGRRRKLEPV